MKVQLELLIGLDACDDLIEGCLQSIEDLLNVPLEKENPGRMVKISSCLDRVTKSRLIALLQENVDLFAWLAADMSGINSEVISHHLRVDPTYQLVKQKKQSFVGNSVPKSIVSLLMVVLNFVYVHEL